MGLLKPPLHGVHDARGAKFTEFGGWDMPVEFDSIRTEHESVREAAGIFDVSHMGEIIVSGPDAEALMQRLTSNDVTVLSPGDAQYSMITNEDGVIIDDTVVYRLPDAIEGDYLFIPNAGHDGEMQRRWETHRDEWGLDASVENVTSDWTMFALQGPDAEKLLMAAVDEHTPAEPTAVQNLKSFTATVLSFDGAECIVARTGYTGEDGFEILAPWDDAEAVWELFDVQPCGLGARDTLRMEMGFLLSGQDFHPEDNPRTPYEAGLSFTVKLDTEFVGRDALERQHAEGVAEKFVGFQLLERGVPRHGYDITNIDEEHIGTVTSGTMSPTLGEPIGLGYVPVDYADPDTTIHVLVRGNPKKAVIKSLPFNQ
ncbi:glycine cleavage system aminomethyltransferase GcvT [Haladaptatus sp. DYSN1]|uniref:glycine cleavage system aminomethyltransferase GcvT n=1 Tax=unclassified Haladaptatus TaxID=2622732 RepID=UPI00240740E8|nr:glycine cleavage system aminomethyltransferase GcvT [Haladaptatus sp. DYSN1]